MSLSALSASPATTVVSQSAERVRIPSVDMLRGAIMLLMALDHTRDFFTQVAFEPETLAQTYPALFITRWVTHFCAPLFFFLAGISAFLYGRRTSPPQLSRFLRTRGVWLILLEFTVVGTAWSFQAPWGFFGVIWALGASMLILALLARLPMGLIMLLSLALILGHNLLDPIRPEQLHSLGWAWTILHARGEIVLPFGIHQFVLFPLIPLVAVMAAGYAFGQLYLLDRERRRVLMVGLGVAASLAFILLRAAHGYGNPPQGLGGVSQGDWHPQATVGKTVILFLDVEKYPPSLQYLLMTLGPSLLLLALLESERIQRGMAFLSVYGRVPLFFYVLHLYLIHWLAVLLALTTGQPVRWLFHGAVFTDTPNGYGYCLIVVYLMWVVVAIIMYFPCRWFVALKSRRKNWWLAYM
jgi:uncharacterized membrane protein